MIWTHMTWDTTINWMEDCESLNLDPVWYLCYNNYDKLQASCLDHKLHISISCLDEVS